MAERSACPDPSWVGLAQCASAPCSHPAPPLSRLVHRPYLTRVPQKPGDPIANVLWQKFAVHVQALADKSGTTDGTGRAGDY